MRLDRSIQAQVLRDRAQVTLAGGLTAAAETPQRQALAIDPQTPAAWLELARIELARNDARAAMRALDGRDLYDPAGRELPHVLELRARTLYALGKPDLAQQQAQRLAHRCPDDVRAHRLLAALALAADKHRSAIEALRRVVALEPSDRAAKRTLARLLTDEKPQEAIDLLRSTDVNDPATSLAVARLLRSVGRLREAREWMETLLAACPEDAGLWLEAGRLSDELGLPGRAGVQLRRAEQLRAGHEALAALAQSQMHAGDLSAAGWTWWKLARSRSADLRAWAGLLVCALALGRTALARRVRGALTTHSSADERRAVIAQLWMHAAQGRVLRLAGEGLTAEAAEERSPLELLLAQARQALRQHARQHPRRADAHYHHAVCAEALGDNPAARESVRCALSLNARYAAAAELDQSLSRRQAA